MFLRPKNGQEAVSALGFYSIVRYVEDVERGEPLNVGVILEVNGDTLPRRVDREQLGGPASESIGRFFDLLGRLIEDDLTQDVEDEGEPPTKLAGLSQRRFPHFQITEPRQIVVEGDPQQSLEDLSSRLAAEPRGVLASSRWPWG
jgi:hypothetical protein